MPVLRSAFDLPRGRLLALDLGQARHGVAVCDEAGMVARPLTVVQRRDTRARDFGILAGLVVQESALGVLIGLPLEWAGNDTALDGVGGEQARWTRRYAGRLAQALRVPVAFWDESFSTVDAARLSAETGSRTPVDALAAALLLQDFLDARRSRDRTENAPLDHPDHAAEEK